MYTNYDIYSQAETHSDYDEYFLSDSFYNTGKADHDYPANDNSKEVYVSESELMKLSLEHYFNSCFSNIIHDRSSFFLFQAELLLNVRKYREALSSCLCFEVLFTPILISKCIKMICYYQLNYSKNFNLLKDDILLCNLDSLSESLRKNVIGTIQVSSWIPELMNCINNMNTNKQ